MRAFGGILFSVGGLFLVIAGLVGIGGTGNIPGLLIGTACMISGSVFVGSSLIVDAISGKDTHVKIVEASTSEIDTNVGSSSNNDGKPLEGLKLSKKDYIIVFGIVVLFFIGIFALQ